MALNNDEIMILEHIQIMIMMMVILFLYIPINLFVVNVSNLATSLCFQVPQFNVHIPSGLRKTKYNRNHFVEHASGK